MNLKGRFNRLTLANQANVIFGAIVTVATVSNVVAVVFQYKVAKDNAKESSYQTKQLIATAKISADAANQNAQASQNFAMSANAISKGVNDAVGKLNLQAEQLNANAEQTRRLAAATEAANRRAGEVDRPWIGVTFTEVNLHQGAAASIIVRADNSGRRPAKFDRLQAAVFARAKFPNAIPYDPSGLISTAIIAQGTRSEVTVTVPAILVSGDNMGKYMSGQLTFFIVANVEYEDVVSHAKHWVHACDRYVPAGTRIPEGLYECPEYNEVDTY